MFSALSFCLYVMESISFHDDEISFAVVKMVFLTRCIVIQKKKSTKLM